MTTTTFETTLDTAVEDLTIATVPCEGLTYLEYDCPNEPVYVVEATCCGKRWNWCETCLFTWVEYAQNYEGVKSQCAYCYEVVVVGTHHVRVVRRIK